VNRHLILEKIAQNIKSYVDKGFIFDETTLHFLDSTFSISSADDLAKLDDVAYDNEREILLYLVVSPDHAFLETIESLLVQEKWTDHDESSLALMLTAMDPFALIRFPDDQRSLGFHVPTDVIEGFIKKIHMAYVFPDILLADMARVPIHLKGTAGVLIRHAGLELNKDTLNFFNRFFRSFVMSDTIFVSHLKCALSVLSAFESSMDIKDLFIKQFHDYQKRLDQVRTLDDMVKKNAMETLMLQGVRIPSMTAESILEKIAMIRCILIEMYGWMNEADLPLSNVDLGDFTGKEGIKKIVSFLS